MKIGDKIRFNGKENYDDLTVGKMYIVTDIDLDGDPYVTDDVGHSNPYFGTSFDSETNTFEAALKLIGTTVLCYGDKFKVEAVTVYNKYYPDNNKTITKEVKENGYCIVLENDEGIVPLADIELVNMSVKLSEDYTAIIDGEVVKVGCQTIPIEKVKDILDLYNKYH